MLIGWLQLISGLIVLVVAGDFLVRSSVKLAVMMKISSLVIGLTVVAFGTSFPELMVSVNAALDGYPDISIGNVIGSNIANLALVMGLTALISPLAIQRKTLIIDWPIMLVASALFVVMVWDLQITFLEGLLLTALIVVYNVWAIWQGRRSNKRREDDAEDEETVNPTNVARTLFIFALSLVGLIGGSELLVGGAVSVAQGFGIEERIIAITIVAFGTSAPELATSLVALYKKESSISVGNLIGSNIFNILAILGITALIKPISVNEVTKTFDLPWFMGIPLLIFPFLIFRWKVGRLEGALLLGSYFTYIWLVF